MLSGIVEQALVDSKVGYKLLYPYQAYHLLSRKCFHPFLIPKVSSLGGKASFFALYSQGRLDEAKSGLLGLVCDTTSQDSGELLDRRIRYHKGISTDSMESGAIPRLLEG